MRVIALLSLVTLSACASGSGGGPAPASQETVRVMGGSGLGTTGSLSISTGAVSSTTKIAYPLDLVWRTLPAAYDSLHIPLSVLDPKTHHLGNEALKVHQKLGSVMLSKYIDCGQAQIGPSADSYDIFLNVTTTLTAASSGETQISTLVESAAKSPNFGQEYSRCQSKGTIENTISSILAAKLAAK